MVRAVRVQMTKPITRRQFTNVIKSKSEKLKLQSLTQLHLGNPFGIG
jgi:hypothetical protein